MDSRGNIFTPDEVKAMREEELANRKLVEIPDEDLPRVKAMSEAERRAWYREMRRGMTKAQRKRRRKEARR